MFVLVYLGTLSIKWALTDYLCHAPHVPCEQVCGSICSPCFNRLNEGKRPVVQTT